MPLLPESDTPNAVTGPPQSNGESRRTVESLPPEAIALATKLFDFARQGKSDELAQYLDAGIPKNICNHKGDSLLMLAAYHGNLETVKMLLAHGADTELLNDRGQSIIAGAIFKGEDEIVSLLYEAGAKVDHGHPTALDSARMFKRPDMLQMFGVTE